LLFTGAVHAERSDVRPLHRAHSHNDGERDVPLFGALELGIASVEADVWLVDDELLVAHDPERLAPELTLRSLYLDPLRERVRERGGVYNSHDQRFQLLIDVKSDAEQTWTAINQELAGDEDVLTVWGPDGVIADGPIQVVVSGERARETMARQPNRFATFDGRIPQDLDAPEPPTFMPMVSQHFAYLGWRKGMEPGDDIRAKLRDAVDRAHAAGRTVRFWSVPDVERVWDVLLDAGVDIIDAKDLERLAGYLRP
jgi:glycerophosphoryl diester phosphodiesterase